MSIYNPDAWKDADPKELIEIAQSEVNALSKGQRWQMCIPVQDSDSDVVISDALKAALNRIEQLEKQVNGFNEWLDKQIGESLKKENENLAEFFKGKPDTFILRAYWQGHRLALEDAWREFNGLPPLEYDESETPNE